MLETAREILKHNRNLRFEVAAASEQLAQEISRLWHRHPADPVDGLEARATIQIKVGETPAIMQRAWAGIVASGSATLEAAYFRLPFVLLYKVAWPTYLAARFVVNVKYLGMPNLLADKEVVPEFIQYRAKPTAIVKVMQSLIENAKARDRMISDFNASVSQLGDTGASERAARAIIEEIRSAT
jgi:lipid-A-disaccharide synthase